MIDVFNLTQQQINKWYAAKMYNIGLLEQLPSELKRREIYSLCFHDFSYFVYIFGGNSYYGVPGRNGLDFMLNIANKIHNETTYGEECRIEKRDRHLYNILAPRGNAKSSLAGMYVVWQILYKREHYVVVVSSTDTTTKELYHQKILSWFHNPHVLAIFRPKIQKLAATELIVNNVKVKPVSIEQPIRGTAFGAERPTLLLADDMQQDRQLRSPKLREAHRVNWERGFMEASRPSSSRMQTNIIMINTAVHPDSIAFRTLTDRTWNSITYKAIVQDSHSKLWEQYDRLAMSLVPEDRDLALDFYSKNEEKLLKGVKINWASGESYLSLRERRLSNPLTFEYEKQNNPYDPSKVMFSGYLTDPTTRAIKSDILFDERDGKITAKEFDLQVMGNHRIIAYCDPAIGTSKNADYTAITIVLRHQSDAYDPLTNVYLVLASFCTRSRQVDSQIKSFLPFLDYWHSFAKKYTKKPLLMGIEQVAFQQLFGSVLLQILADKGYPSLQKDFQVTYCNPIATQLKLDKHQAITAILYQAGIANRRLLFNREWICNEFWDQLLNFPTDAHDDLPDSLASAIRLSP